MKNINKTIKKIISQQLGISQENINEDSNLINDLNADSLDIVELIMTLEEIFNIEIPDEQAEKLVSIKSIIKIIQDIKNNTPN